MNKYTRLASLSILIALTVLLLIFARDYVATGGVLYLPLMGKYQA